MSSVRGACPGCGLLVTMEGPEAVTCPICNLTCSSAALDGVDPAAACEVPPTAAVPAALQRQVRLGAAGLGIVAFLAVGLAWAYQSAPHAAPPPPVAAARTPTPSPPMADEAPPLVDDAPVPPPPDRPPPVTPKPILPAVQPTQRPPQPASDSLDERVARAMERGLTYLKHSWGRGQYESLLGLTLLECGVPAGDVQVQELAQQVRGKQDELHTTYELSLAILFLARLGEAQDRAVIRSFALRLAAGQNGDGAWSYNCPLLDAARERKAEAELRALRFASPDSSLAVRVLATPLPPPQPPRPPQRQRARQPLPWPGEPNILGPFGPLPLGNAGRPNPGRPINVVHPGGDHSNTQFALLGLWTARRLGVPTDWCLRRAAYHFRHVVAPDGFWGYFSAQVSAAGHPLTASSTCAGLLALAMEYGLHSTRTGSGRMSRVVPVSDPHITDALHYLGEVLAGRHPRVGVFSLQRPLLDVDARGDLYFLWSLERVAVVYEIDRFGGRDWYLWAAPRLVEAQQADGCWNDVFGGVIDTCFALLALKRSNVVRDLTDSLQGVVHTGQGKRPTPQGGPVQRTGPRPALEGTITMPPNLRK